MSTLFLPALVQDQPLATRIFQTAIETNKLAKAYMLVGHTTEKKWQLVTQLAAYLNCQNAINTKQSCLVNENSFDSETWCTNCRWIKEDQHPQALMKLTGAASKSGKIGVEQARNFAQEVGKSSPYFRVLVIEDSNQDILHRPAANALLKTIEEPRSKVLMIFFAQAISDVLPTIKSRCQTINMHSSQQNSCLSLVSPNTLEQSLKVNQSEDLLLNICAPLEKFRLHNSTLLDAINFSDAIQALSKDGLELELILDYVVTKDLLSLNNIFAEDAEARYAKELFLLSQIASEQSKHYVSEKALIESFIFAWHKLKQTGISPVKLQR